MMAILLVVFALLLVQLIVALVNLAAWPKLERMDGHDGERVRVSVLVPVRNEEANIRACVMSLLEQEGVVAEVICLDDQSEDSTPEVLAKLSSMYPTLCVIQGQPLPDGWFGKAHACHQLSQVATGDWLLYVDADTVWSSDAIARILKTARRRNVDLLTGFPRVTNNHWMGWLVTSMMTVVIAFHLPVRLVERSSDPRFVAACGMMMCFSRKAYQQIGGHEISGQHLVDDMALAKAVKRAGLKVGLVDISDVGQVDMYRRPSDVLQGFAKNLFAGIGGRFDVLAGIVLYYGVLFLLPAASLIISVVNALIMGHVNALLWWSLGSVALGYLLKAVVDHRFRVPPTVAPLFPASFALLICIALYSAWRLVAKRGYEWKGRRYT